MPHAKGSHEPPSTTPAAPLPVAPGPPPAPEPAKPAEDMANPYR
jgi:hypothetical protein